MGDVVGVGIALSSGGVILIFIALALLPRLRRFS
jgi:hypothetical protein